MNSLTTASKPLPKNLRVFTPRDTNHARRSAVVNFDAGAAIEARRRESQPARIGPAQARWGSQAR